MPANILVPLDGSLFSEQALGYAMDIAERCDAVVHLVRVHTTPILAVSAAMPAYYSAESDEEVTVAEREYLDRIGQKWHARGRHVRVASLSGPIATAIHEYADRCAVDLIVMTTHGRGGLSRAWLGSVADRLVRATHIPVIMLRPHNSDAEPVVVNRTRPHILIPLDGSELAESIIGHAVDIGALLDARYTLLQVVPPPIAVSPAVREQALRDTVALRAEARTYLDRWAMRLRARGFHVDTRVVLQSQSAIGIVEEALAGECDMIAMATHGRSGFTRMALGSVADKVMRTASAPLLTLSGQTTP